MGISLLASLIIVANVGASLPPAPETRTPLFDTAPKSFPKASQPDANHPAFPQGWADNVAYLDGRHAAVYGWFLVDRYCPDPRNQNPQHEDAIRIYIGNDHGERTEILAGPGSDLVRQYGGVSALQGKIVKVTGVFDAAAKTVQIETLDLFTPDLLRYPGSDRPYFSALGLYREKAPGQFQRSPFQEAADNRPYLNVLLRTSDSTGVSPHIASYYQAFLRNTFPGMDHMIQQASYGKTSITGSQTLDWQNLPKTKVQYCSPGNGVANLYDSAKLFADIQPLIDANVNFASWWGMNFCLNVTDDFNGFYATYVHVTADGQDRWMPCTVLDGPQTSQQIYAHEMGHNIGFPHCSGPYSTPYDSQWDSMSSGNYQANAGSPFGTNFNVGTGYIAYNRNKNKWIDANKIYYAYPGTSTTIRLERLETPTTNDYLMAKVFIRGGNSYYYTVEARKKVGYDTGVPLEGVLIHQVDEFRRVEDIFNPGQFNDDRYAQVVDSTNDNNPNDAGAIWTPGETYSDAPSGISIQVLSGDATGYTVKITVSGSQPMPGVVYNSNATGPGSLIDCLTYLNDFPNQTLTFKIPTSDPSFNGKYFKLSPTRALPDITATGATIDGSSQTTFTGNTNVAGPEIQIDGTNAGQWTYGLMIKGSGNTVKGLAIANYQQSGIQIQNATGATVQDCYLSTDAEALANQSNLRESITVLDSSGVLLKGNLIARAQYDGVWLQRVTNCNLENNYLGYLAGWAASAMPYTCLSMREYTNVTVGGAPSKRNYFGNAANYGMFVDGGTGLEVSGNYFGIAGNGLTAAPITYSAIYMRSDATGFQIGKPSAPNYIGNCGSNGLALESVYVGKVQSNYIGLCPDGSTAAPVTGEGIACWGSTIYPQFGGPNSGEGNLIGNTSNNGIYVGRGYRIAIQGNLIGFKKDGLTAAPVGGSGIWMNDGGAYNLIGGSTATQRNVIGNCAYQGVVLATMYANEIHGNYIGFGKDGKTAAPIRYSEILIFGAGKYNVIGAPGKGNVIGNTTEGNAIQINDAATDYDVVQGNLIGLGADLNTAAPVRWSGVSVTADAYWHYIGGSNPGEGNRIANTSGAGLWIDSPRNQVVNNQIGFANDGNVNVPFGDDCIGMGENARDCTVSGNRLGNGKRGIALWGSDSNAIRANIIGLNTSYNPAPFQWEGIMLTNGATGNYIGNGGAASGNLVTNCQRGIGIWNDATFGNPIRFNRIWDNSALGIDLTKNDGSFGVTANDALDADTGPNNLQNFPTFTSVSLNGSNWQIGVTLNSVANKAYAIDIYVSPSADPSNYGEGQYYLGSVTVTTNGSGVATTTVSLPHYSGTYGKILTATATDLATGDTSEFSLRIVGP
ncbi:MAG: right-handed parallel beta-helix repeat-containing protein [Armatimonadetes bacterium]|nr:right-handed parallel beta-helix repeat-containing protein [Armatimonadota bacterium]